MTKICKNCGKIEKEHYKGYGEIKAEYCYPGLNSQKFEPEEDYGNKTCGKCLAILYKGFPHKCDLETDEPKKPQGCGKYYCIECDNYNFGDGLFEHNKSCKLSHHGTIQCGENGNLCSKCKPKISMSKGEFEPLSFQTPKNHKEKFR